MVRVWDVELDKAIQTTKRRIKHAEKHGIGKMAIEEKATLLKQERLKELKNK